MKERLPTAVSLYPMSAPKEGRMRTASNIMLLPPEAREKLESMLADLNNGLTYQDMVEIMAEDGHQLSRSAICRHARRYLRHIQRMQMVQEQTRILLQYMEENPGTDLARQINALIQNGLMWRIVDGQDEIGEMDIEDAIKLSIQAQRAAVYEYRYKDAHMQRVETELKEDEEQRLIWLRHAFRDNPEMLSLLERQTSEATGGEAGE